MSLPSDGPPSSSAPEVIARPGSPASAFQRGSAVGSGSCKTSAFVYYPRLLRSTAYLAGSDAARAAELNALFADPAIKAIFAVVGLRFTAPVALSRYGHDHGPSENLCGL